MQFPIIAPYARDLGASATLVGVIVAAYSVTNLFGNLAAGFVLDRWGRRLPVTLGLGITVLAVLSYAFVRSPEQLLAARLIHGIGAAALTPGAFAIIGDLVPSDRRGRAMGLAGALIAVPAVIGPPAAGILRDAWSANAVFLADGAFMVVTLITFVVATRETRRSSDSRNLSAATESRPAMWHSRLWSAYAAQFAITVGVGVLVAQLPLVLEDQGETAAVAGSSFAIYALVSMLVMASPIGGASDRIGRFPPLIVGLVGVAAGLAVVGTAAGYGGIAIGMAIFRPWLWACVSRGHGLGRRSHRRRAPWNGLRRLLCGVLAGGGRRCGWQRATRRHRRDCLWPAILRGSRRRFGCASRCRGAQAQGKNERVTPHPEYHCFRRRISGDSI